MRVLRVYKWNMRTGLWRCGCMLCTGNCLWSADLRQSQQKHDKLIRVHARLWYTVGYGIAMGAHDFGVAMRVLSTLVFVHYW